MKGGGEWKKGVGVVRDSESTRYNGRMPKPHTYIVEREGVPKEREVNSSREVCSGRGEPGVQLKFLFLEVNPPKQNRVGKKKWETEMLLSHTKLQRVRKLRMR